MQHRLLLGGLAAVVLLVALLRVELAFTRHFDTDELAQAALRSLFAIEDELGVGTVFWYQMIGWVADMADYAERVGNRIRVLIAT